jgi:hypothetical protein
MRIYAKGDRVSQANYGSGTVAAANEHHTVIDFDEHGRRTFATRLVVLETSTVPAPARVKRAARAKPAARPRPATQT